MEREGDPRSGVRGLPGKLPVHLQKAGGFPRRWLNGNSGQVKLELVLNLIMEEPGVSILLTKESQQATLISWLTNFSRLIKPGLSLNHHLGLPP